MTSPLRIALADDHPLYRDGVARTLAAVAGLEVVGQAQDGEGAVELVQRVRPDLLLLDISMPKGGGLGALAQIMVLQNPPKVAMLTASEEDADLLQALKLGACGYILKGVGAQELVALVQDLAAGQTHVAPAMAVRMLGSLRMSAQTTAAVNPLESLTHREEDILRLVALGQSNKEVGLALNLQEKTVKHYMTSILQKLQARNRVEAAMLAKTHLKG